MVTRQEIHVEKGSRPKEAVDQTGVSHTGAAEKVIPIADQPAFHIEFSMDAFASRRCVSKYCGRGQSKGRIAEYSAVTREQNPT